MQQVAEHLANSNPFVPEKRLQQREEQFAALLEHNHARWNGIARCYAGSADAEDLLQDILLQIWKSLDSFAGRSRLDTWAYRVALNTALTWNHQSRKQLPSVDTQTVAASVPDDATNASSQQNILSEFLASLSKTDRAVMLMFLDDVPSPEAAEVLGISEGAVRVRLHRLRRRFEATYCERNVNNDL